MNHQTATDFLGLLLTTAASLFVGWAIFALTQVYRKLRKRTTQAFTCLLHSCDHLRRIQDQLNDIHNLLRAVTKSLEKQSR